METARRELQRMRESTQAWADVAYSESNGGDGNAARRAMVLWALQYDRGPADLPLVRWLAEQEARCLREAPFQGLTAQREAVAWAEDSWDAASAWCTLAALERQAGDHCAAWAALGQGLRALNDVSGWREVGLGREYAEQLFLVAGSGEEFAEADRWAREIPGLPPVVLRAAVAAADRAGATEAAQHYRARQDDLTWRALEGPSSPA